MQKFALNLMIVSTGYCLGKAFFAVPDMLPRTLLLLAYSSLPCSAIKMGMFGLVSLSHYSSISTLGDRDDQELATAIVYLLALVVLIVVLSRTL